MKYDNPACNTFVEDMRKAGFTVEHRCRNLFFAEGPAVVVARHRVRDAMEAASVPVQVSEMDGRLVVFPQRRGRSVESPEDEPPESHTQIYRRWLEEQIAIALMKAHP